jgi:hypothetical protein
MPNVVFDPLLHGFLPKIFFPDRIDLNNGMVIGRLLGYVGSEENAYMATTIFTDLLIGAPYLISAIALIVFFSFVLFLARFALAGNIYPPMDVRLLTYCLSISLVFNTESNFAFYVITFFKNILILYIFNRLHIRFFPRSSPVFNSIGGAQLL